MATFKFDFPATLAWRVDEVARAMGITKRELGDHCVEGEEPGECFTVITFEFSHVDREHLISFASAFALPRWIVLESLA